MSNFLKNKSKKILIAILAVFMITLGLPKVEKAVSNVTPSPIYSGSDRTAGEILKSDLANGKKIKFWKVKVLDENETKTLEAELKKEASLGEVVKADDKLGLYIKTKEGIISVLEIQGENGKRMGICDFLRGNKIEVGERFD